MCQLQKDDSQGQADRRSLGPLLYRVPGTPGSGRTLSPETRLALVAAGDDLLLEDAFRDATERAGGSMSQPAVETLPDDVTPEDVAVELNSPSLFNPERVLLVPDTSQWVIASTSPGGPTMPARKNAKAVDTLVQPLVRSKDPQMARSQRKWCSSNVWAHGIQSMECHIAPSFAACIPQSMLCSTNMQFMMAKLTFFI